MFNQLTINLDILGPLTKDRNTSNVNGTLITTIKLCGGGKVDTNAAKRMLKSKQ